MLIEASSVDRLSDKESSKCYCYRAVYVMGRGKMGVALLTERPQL